MNAQTEKCLVPGPAGAIEVSVDRPKGPVLGYAVVAHPNPVQGGTMDNKVVHTIARSFLSLGYLAVRPNFRGVGASEGEHDNGLGEREDLLAVFDWMLESFPESRTCLHWAVGGFSFGTAVLSHCLPLLAQRGIFPERIVFTGTATQRFSVANVPAFALIIHGEVDDVIPLSAVLDWARPQGLPITVIPGAGHFFHGLLGLLKTLITQHPPHGSMRPHA